MNGGATLVGVLVTLPLAAAILAFLWPRRAAATSVAGGALVLLAAAMLVFQVYRDGPWRMDIGGWAVPLGIAWNVDGLAAGMILLAAAVAIAGAAFHAQSPVNSGGGRDPALFWPLWLFLWGCLNALFLSADLFNLYVTLEFVAIASVGLIALAGDAARAAAWRYLLATLLGSSIYLLGVALLYGLHATLDIALLATLTEPDLVSAVAALLITLGLLLKAAVFPLHFWLPAAHGRASPGVSAILSGVVVAAAYYLLLRLWPGPFAVLLDSGAGLLLGLLGAGGVIWGGVQALLQRHLKMLVAYSTVAQLGYVLMMIPLLATEGAVQAGHGASMLVLSHGLAKAALFLAAGAVVLHHGHDRLDALAGAGSATRLAWVAFALAAASLVGLPPTGGFIGKWWLAQAALAGDTLLWVAVLVLGTLLTAAYLWRALRIAARPADPLPQPAATLPPLLPWGALLLATAALALGLAAPLAEALLHQQAEGGA